MYLLRDARSIILGCICFDRSQNPPTRYTRRREGMRMLEDVIQFGIFAATRSPPEDQRRVSQSFRGLEIRRQCFSIVLATSFYQIGKGSKNWPPLPRIVSAGLVERLEKLLSRVGHFSDLPFYMNCHMPQKHIASQANTCWLVHSASTSSPLLVWRLRYFLTKLFFLRRHFNAQSFRV